MSELSDLQEKVDFLLDRQAILDCVNRYCRGLDRHDADITISAYHEDGIDEHGKTVNSASQYAEWANALHSSRFELHNHNITTHNCEIDGNIAHSETYVLFGLVRKGKEAVWLGGGRYLDRLEKRAGEWRIAARRTIIDWMFSADASPMREAFFAAQGYPAGTHDKTDPSYQRPLTIDWPTNEPR